MKTKLEKQMPKAKWQTQWRLELLEYAEKYFRNNEWNYSDHLAQGHYVWKIFIYVY